MKLPTQIKSVLFSFFLAATTPLFAAPITANFTDGNTTSETDGYAGKAGDGWAGAWDINGNRLSNYVGSVVNTNPINNGGNYLSATFSTTTSTTGSNNSQGTVQRQLATGGGASGFTDISKPVTLSFDLRLDSTLTSSQAYLLFGSTTNFKGTGPDNTWSIIGNGGDNWKFGAGTGVDSGISVVFGKTYHFTLEIDPTTKSYLASVSDGTNSFTTSTAINFRSTSATDIGQYLNFGAKLNNGTLTNTSVSLSLDNLSVIPEPSTVALLGAVAGIGAITTTVRRRRNRIS